MKVKVHWNLHKGGYSVTNTKTKLVMPEFTDNIVITNPVAAPTADAEVEEEKVPVGATA